MSMIFYESIYWRCHKIDNTSKLEVALWSIAIPGFGQLLNKKYVKGLLLIGLEFLINMNSNLNTAIVSSFYGNTSAAIDQIDYQWLMFYPCVYMFAIWDAYKDSVTSTAPLSFIPFALAAYFGTIGVIYSKTFILWGVLFGPVWLPILAIFFGIAIGLLIRKAIL
ncbi:hypothetical protein [Brassicibacter mesophilus]|uniref:hypothetical protein n=1 Tax=Brassicibacter mesophilus TaxID=745119 RepID=UPI003D1B9552